MHPSGEVQSVDEKEVEVWKDIDLYNADRDFILKGTEGHSFDDDGYIRTMKKVKQAGVVLS